MTRRMVYAGIGSRETPPGVLSNMKFIATVLARSGHRLRSGGAVGADQAFQQGCEKGQGEAEIYLPWNTYNGIAESRKHRGIRVYAGVGQKAMEVAAKYHPAWERCTGGARKLHARNSYIFWGLGLEDVGGKAPDFVICWTKDGKASGGTGQLLRIAEDMKVPVVNLHDERWQNVFASLENVLA